MSSDPLLSGGVWARDYTLLCFRRTHKHCSMTVVKQCICTPLTSVHSNVYGLGKTKSIRYLTAVDPFLSSSSALQKYHTLISGSVEIPLVTSAGNSSSIGEEPVPRSIRRSATSS